MINNLDDLYHVQAVRSKNFTKPILFYLDEDGWALEINNNENISTVSKSANSLKSHDLISISESHDSIGPRHLLKQICSYFQFNHPLIEKVHDMTQLYIGWRQMRGDGNCYYRSIMFGLIEYLIVTSSFVGFSQLAAIFDKINTSNPCVLEVCRQFQDTADGKGWQTLDVFESEMYDDKLLDWNIVSASRLLVCHFIMAHVGDDLTSCGMCLRDLLLLTSQSQACDVESYCAKEVQPMGVDAQGAVVELGLLAMALGINTDIALLDRRAGVPVTHCCGGLSLLDVASPAHKPLIVLQHKRKHDQQSNAHSELQSLSQSHSHKRMPSTDHSNSSYIHVYHCEAGGDDTYHMISSVGGDHEPADSWQPCCRHEEDDNEREENDEHKYAVPTVYLLLRPGHFDLLYAKDSAGIVQAIGQYRNTSAQGHINNHTRLFELSSSMFAVKNTNMYLSQPAMASSSSSSSSTWISLMSVINNNKTQDNDDNDDDDDDDDDDNNTQAEDEDDNDNEDKDKDWVIAGDTMTIAPAQSSAFSSSSCDATSRRFELNRTSCAPQRSGFWNRFICWS